MTAHFAQGDIIRVDFDPSAGHEQIKRRYAVVVSNAAFNRICNLTMVCPITSTDNGYPLHVDLQEPTTLLGTSAITGFVQIEQLNPWICTPVTPSIAAPYPMPSVRASRS